jgi:hypothetical protein
LAQKTKRKNRLRIADACEHVQIEATHKYKVSAEDGDVRREIEKIVYREANIEDALTIIKLQGSFEEENSYEKSVSCTQAITIYCSPWIFTHLAHGSQ